MKIESNTPMNYYTSYMDVKKQTSQPFFSRKTEPNFDEITIQADQEISPEQAFAGALSSRLSLEIKRPTSAAQIQNLQQQIAQGAYEVDINSIVDKIMLY